GNSRNAHGVGDDPHSWGLEFNGSLKHKGHTLPDQHLKLPWTIGDVVGCLLDLEERQIQFARNGDWSPGKVLAFEHIVFSTAVAPMVSFECGMVFRMNPGSLPFRYPMPAGARSVHQWVRRRMRQMYVAEAGPRLGTLVPHGVSREVIITGWRVEPNQAFAETTSTRTIFPSVRLDGVLLTDGRWYYEVVVKDPGVAQIGWFDVDFWASSKAGVGVGDDKSSWGYDGNRVLKWYDQVSVGWGSSTPWASGDVISVAVDVNDRTIRYARNGDWSPPMGLAFANVTFAGGFTPGFTLQGGPMQSFSCLARFGDPDDQPLQHPPPGEGYRPVWDAVLEGRKLLALLANGHHLMPESMSASMSSEPMENSLTSSLSVVPFSELKSLQLTVTSGYHYVMISDGVVTASEHYPSLICDGVRFKTGRWFFEISVLNIGHDPNEHKIPLIAVGWGTQGFFGDAVGLLGVGDDAYSWAIDNLCRMRHQGRLSHSVGHSFKKRDVIGCLADLDRRQLLFFVNGRLLTTMTMPRHWPIFPAFSVRSGGGAVNAFLFNFGDTPFKFPQPDVHAVNEVLGKNQAELGPSKTSIH
ncbi:MAG: SPRY domain-containing protein, partial [archaeon]|nr:SPRY domain-containing protein [archaeon]